MTVFAFDFLSEMSTIVYQYGLEHRLGNLQKQFHEKYPREKVHFVHLFK